MKKLWAALCFLMCLSASALNKYVATAGNDGNAGTIGSPYLTFGKAATVAINSGDSIIFGSGTFTQVTQVLLAPSVSVRGAGAWAGGTRINLSFTVTGPNGYNSAAIQMVTGAVNNNIGNQSITGIWFDGSNFACLNGILVRCRSYVIFDRCKFTNFGITTLVFNGKTNNSTGLPPAIFSEGNQVTNCTLLDCNDLITQAANSISAGSISYSGQRNLRIQYDTGRNINKAIGHNGDILGSVQGNNIGTQILNNVFQKPPDEGTSFNFILENWYDQGGSIFAYNHCTGGGNHLDIGYGSANKGDSAYSWWIHHNTFTNPSLLTSSPGVQPVLSMAIQFESSTNIGLRPQNATNGDAIIEYNTCNNMGEFVQIGLSNYAGDRIDNININHNDLHNMGFANNTYAGVFQFGLSNGVAIDSIYIYNNTIVGCAGPGAPKAILILQPDVGVISNIFFWNNINQGITPIGASPSGYGYLLFRGNNRCLNISSQANINFQNAFSNNPAFLGYATTAPGIIAGKSYTIISTCPSGNCPPNIATSFTSIGAANNNPGTVFTATGAGSGTGTATFNTSNINPPTNLSDSGNLKINPQFVSTTDFHLQAGAQGLSRGRNPPNVYIGAYPGGTTTPTITWAPAAITYGTTFAGSMTATTGVAGTYLYQNGATTLTGSTLLGAGTYSLTVTFTPTDQATYSTVAKTITFTVNKAVATLSYSAPSLSQAYTGSGLQPTIITSPAGLSGVSTTYNGLSPMPINANSYTVVSGLNNPNYTASTITNTFTITKAFVTISITNTSQVYNTTPRSVTTSTSPVDVGVVTVTYNGGGAPTNAASYTLNATLSNANYQATPVGGTLVISKATPTVSWATPTAITYGTALSGANLNATATGVAGSLPGVFTYTPASGTVPNAGSQILSVDFAPTDGANYNSVAGTTVTIVVNKAVATITLSGLTGQIYDGTQKSATATTNPVGLGGVTISYVGSRINAGTYPATASLSNANYTATDVTGDLVISKATATLSISNTSYIFNNTPRSVTVSTVPAGLGVITITYNGSTTAPTNANTYAVVATLANANYTATAANATLTISKATPVISWATPAAITYGTALSGANLNASASVAGTLTYSPVSGTILNAGVTNPLFVDFVPTDAANYNSVSGTTVNIVVNKATAVITLSNLNQDYDGNPKPVTVSVSPNVGVVTVLYNGSATVPSAIGSYLLDATLSNTNYQGTASGTLVISQSFGNVVITNYNQTYTGSALSVTVTSPYSTETRYNGSLTPPTNAGSYTTIATINDGVHSGADTAIFIIAKANPVISWATPGAITFGTALSGAQLNATSPVAGVFTYSPASGYIPNVGTQVLSVSFAPSDASNYNSIPVTTVNLTVNKAAATIDLSGLTHIFDGSQKSAIATTTPAGLVTVTITYNGSTTPPSAVGSYQAIATLASATHTATPDTATLTISSATASITISNTLQIYNAGAALPVTVSTNPTGISYTVSYNGSATVPTVTGSYTVIATLTGGTYTGADTQTLVINKATPVLTWANPADISFGTALGATELNATTPVAGSIVYTPAAGSVLNVGPQSLSGVFTPTDAANYNSVTKVVSITVTGASATLTLSNLAQTYNTLTHPVTVVTSPAGLSGVTILYNGSSSPPTDAGTYTIAVTLVNSNFTATPVNGTLVVAKALPILSWAIPTQIPYGTALSSLQLNATANIGGTFTYSPNFGTVLNPGTTGGVATFHPTDNINYMNGRTISVPISVGGLQFQLWYLTHGNSYYEEE